MTKQQFLDRCANAWNMGLANEVNLRLAEKWCDGVMRLEGGQFNYWVDLLEEEQQRTEHFRGDKTLANDRIGYQVIQLLAIFTHPCQKCAVDPEAWHTRSGFCPHKDEPIAS